MHFNFYNSKGFPIIQVKKSTESLTEFAQLFFQRIRKNLCFHNFFIDVCTMGFRATVTLKYSQK